jgi:uncharacterized membrane protein YjgN (DUF898 family)
MNPVCPLCNTPCHLPQGAMSQPMPQTLCRQCGANLVIVASPQAFRDRRAAVGALRGPGGTTPSASSGMATNGHTTTRIFCQHCNTAYVFPEDKLHRPLTKSTCRKCSTPFVFFTMSEEGLDTVSAESPRPGAPLVSDHGQSSESATRHLSFHGVAGSLFGIHIVNVLLSLVTLGVYCFWGRTRIRRYLLSQCAFEGDRFAYHGTGRELFIGWLRALLIFGVPLILLSVVRDVLEVRGELKVLAGLLIYGIGLLFIPVAVVGARRYRLSRTSWRGIRFSFRGHAIDFLKLFVKNALLTGLTLGLYYPIYHTKRHAFLVSHSHFGNQAFTFDGEGRDLLKSYMLMLLLFPFTLGSSWFWFQAKQHRYFWDHTSIATARFHSTVTWGPLIRLHVGNLLLLLVTLGLGWPWVTSRNVQFMFKHVSLKGALDVATIQQEAQIASATGEGLASFFDFLDVGFDLG